MKFQIENTEKEQNREFTFIKWCSNEHKNKNQAEMRCNMNNGQNGQND